MQTSGTPVYAFGPFRLDPAERRLLVGNEPLLLSPKVLDTLVVLVEADGRLVTKEALMHRLWPDTVVEEVNLARNVSLLRKALADRDGQTYIETVPKSGYRLGVPVTSVRVAADLHDPRVADADLDASSPARTSSGKRSLSRALAGLLVAAASIAGIAVWRGAVQRDDGAGAAIGSPGVPAVESAQPHPGYVRATFDGNVVESALSPDGKLVASVLRDPKMMRLVVRDVASGSALDVLRGHFLFRPKWSPDGSSIAVTWRPEVNRAGYLAVVPRLGGPPEKLVPSGYSTSWSPDGTRFAVGRSYGGFSIYGADGVLVKDVPLGGFQWLKDLEWSRASDRVLLWTESEQQHTILWLISPDTAEVRQFYAPKTLLLGATWSFDGSAIYVLRPVDETAELVRLPLARRSDSDDQVLVRGLTAGKGLSLSADGTKLLFKRVTAVANLWRVTVDDRVEPATANTVQLTRGASRLLSPALSPDGRSIAFVSAGANDAVIHKAVLPPDGPWETLTQAGLNVQSAGWSPDGSHIAFVAAVPGGPSLWIVGSNGAAPSAATAAKSSAASARTWPTPG